MSCWVVPTLAAELWHVPLEQLMRRIRDGEIPVRDEDGFTFVDVAPFGPRIESPLRQPHERPAMCTPSEEADPNISDEEAAAFSEEIAEPVAANGTDDEMGPPDTTASLDIGDWRTARQKAGRSRIPPMRRKLSA